MLPQRIGSLREENNALRAQLSEITSPIMAMQKRLAELSGELESIKDREGWAVQRRRNHSSPLPMTPHNPIEITNRFTPLTAIGDANPPPPPPAHKTTPPSPTPPAHPSHPRSQAPIIPHVTAVGSQDGENQNGVGLFYLRAIPRSTKLEEVKEKLTNIGVPASTLSYPASLDAHSHRIYMTLSLTTDEANKLASTLEGETNLGWFVSVIPPRAPKFHRASRLNLHNKASHQDYRPPHTRGTGPQHNRGPPQCPTRPPVPMQPCMQTPTSAPICIPHQVSSISSTTNARTPPPIGGPQSQAPQPPSFAQVLSGDHRCVGPRQIYNNPNIPLPRAPQSLNLPTTNSAGNFRVAIPPLMSLKLGHGMYGDGT